MGSKQGNNRGHLAGQPSCPHFSLKAPKKLPDGDQGYPARRCGRARHWKQVQQSLTVCQIFQAHRVSSECVMSRWCSLPSSGGDLLAHCVWVEWVGEVVE